MQTLKRVFQTHRITLAVICLVGVVSWWLALGLIAGLLFASLTGRFEAYAEWLKNEWEEF